MADRAPDEVQAFLSEGTSTAKLPTVTADGRPTSPTRLPADVSSELLDELMRRALDEARLAPAHGDVPIGAVVARAEDSVVLAARHNERELVNDPTAHAEILALRDAAQVTGTWRLDGCVLAVTVEPCPMCAGAAVAARVDLVAFGAADPKAGALGSLYQLGADPRLNHEFTVVDAVRADESATLLREFFISRRR